jgi:cytochrome c oxidase subunit 2
MDVQHGVKILRTNVNMMILPGQVSTLSATFEEPGTYQFICHEYCGAAHHTMYGQIIVEEPSEELPAEEANAANALSRLVARFVP